MIAFVVVALARNPAEQIEHVELDRRMTQQMDDVAETLGILQAKSVAAVADGPIFALFAEDSFLHSIEARHWIGSNNRAIPGVTRLRCHLNFCRRFRRFAAETDVIDGSYHPRQREPTHF